LQAGLLQLNASLIPITAHRRGIGMHRKCFSLAEESVPRKRETPRVNEREWFMLWCIGLDMLFLLGVPLLSERLHDSLSVEEQHNVSSFPCDQPFTNALNAVQDWA